MAKKKVKKNDEGQESGLEKQIQSADKSASKPEVTKSKPKESSGSDLKGHAKFAKFRN